MINGCQWYLGEAILDHGNRKPAVSSSFWCQTIIFYLRFTNQIDPNSVLYDIYTIFSQRGSSFRSLATLATENMTRSKLETKLDPWKLALWKVVALVAPYIIIIATVARACMLVSGVFVQDAGRSSTLTTKDEFGISCWFLKGLETNEKIGSAPGNQAARVQIRPSWNSRGSTGGPPIGKLVVFICGL